MQRGRHSVLDIGSIRRRNDRDQVNDAQRDRGCDQETRHREYAPVRCKHQDDEKSVEGPTEVSDAANHAENRKIGLPPKILSPIKTQARVDLRSRLVDKRKISADI